MYFLQTVLLCSVLFFTWADARLRNPWVLVDRDLNLWSCAKTTQTHDHFPGFPEYNSQNPDEFFKSMHDSICAGEHRCNDNAGGIYSDWGGDCLKARKNEYFAHFSSNPNERPLGGGDYLAVLDPIKFLNGYGSCYCYGAAGVLVNYYQTLGFESRSVALNGHVITEVYYNGRWHYFDWDEGGWGADANGVTFGVDSASARASIWEQCPVKSDYFWSFPGDLDYIKGAIASPVYLIFGADNGSGGDMSLCLRIGEKIERFYQMINSAYLHPRTSVLPAYLGNARITYEPTLKSGFADYKDGIYDEENAVLDSNGVCLTAGYAVWAVRSPYAIYNSIVSVDSSGNLSTEISFDLGKTWVSDTSEFQAQQFYSYLLKISGTGTIKGLKIVTIAALNPGGLPILRPGMNNVRFVMYENDETFAFVPDWRTEASFNKHVVDKNEYAYGPPSQTGRNQGMTTKNDSGAYLTFELDGPQNGTVVSLSGHMTAFGRAQRPNFIVSPTNTFSIKVGNSIPNLALSTTAPPHMHGTTLAGGFGSSGWAINFERDSIAQPGTKAYVQLLNTGQAATIAACELYMHYYVNHLDKDYLNDIKITHIINTNNGASKDTIVHAITAKQIADNNGVIDYTVDATGAWVKDPSYCIIMEVEGGVLISDLQEQPTAGIVKDIFRENERMSGISLEQNTPNPFNPLTEIRFTIKGPSREIQLAVYNIKGELIKILKDEIVDPGEHVVKWDCTTHRNAKVNSGIYVCKLTDGNVVFTRKMIFVR
ncbi:MAG: hypothetical protein A2268_14420 [Candidatus Raymondbacteria bacterium RifOxyA12_full_50_37]|uniref:Secretion system C-terminal sorting domain-containing protein n=1 Tax=Candidatus Raymondbacteria bacterium RIFOXYD12_FULL_49_13 TaxID=1817890 RepID=A0A1F7F9G1_UNCRA|nr:MAG: hypothetical protein A2268_14420 [Candidatus Raymondbacteria bacterium RifOxyA12_full_50_37]OGJ87456.1 MAG: hypothetical protein A2350_13875 [Candidatus Raymondbacteria bacterium RifOxyB12_full_50_8]OGJ88615.1 MAG: hypothetical protein A2248_20355 [Candidatus Raymondbacteria bacterium RIFOXYA2_FULL_49_16]OGK02908.1 MAG: hypothetical protein A2487_17955 [Candidatus Raymondbacteria bacterium RifOxyC12_full_50_8]OGK03146.1 MAG: hypothetical protein A2519_07010 [Candidatus Raymondbacteria b